MAIAAGICSGSNYFSQPLIHSIALSLALPETSVAWIPTCAQISYAIGLLVLMPLGDLLEKRQLVVILMVLAACGLLITGSADRLEWMIVGTILTGLFSVSAQLLLPLAASLVPITQSGRVVGFLISALMLGILLARSLSGLASTLWHWQIIYVISGIALLMIAFMLYRKLDVFPATQLYANACFYSSIIKKFTLLGPTRRTWFFNFCECEHGIYYNVFTTCACALSFF